MGGVTLAAGNVDQFTVALDVDTQNEEIVFVTAVSGDTFTIVRGRAGSSAISHSGGATVKHVLTSDDLTFYTTGVATADAAIPETVVTAKADLLVGASSGVVDNLAVGTNGQVLTADSAETLGVKWSAAASGDVTLNGVQTLTNKTLTAPIISTITNTGTITLPTSTDTLVGKATTDTLTNKTLTTPVISIGLNAQTAAYTLQSTDKNKLVTITSASAANFTVPSGVFSAGDVVYIARLGTGTVAATASGTTINGTPGLNLRAQYSTSAIICTASNTFLLVGDLAA
jgi:hypothetical protein